MRNTNILFILFVAVVSIIAIGCQESNPVSPIAAEETFFGSVQEKNTAPDTVTISPLIDYVGEYEGNFWDADRELRVSEDGDTIYLDSLVGFPTLYKNVTIEDVEYLSFQIYWILVEEEEVAHRRYYGIRDLGNGSIELVEFGCSFEWHGDCRNEIIFQGTLTIKSVLEV